jgi:hypothetical protein
MVFPYSRLNGNDVRMVVPMESVQIEHNAPPGKGLRAGALGLVSSVVIAV